MRGSWTNAAHRTTSVAALFAYGAVLGVAVLGACELLLRLAA